VKDRFCLWYATCGCVGYLPFAPGTFASALTCVGLYLFPPIDNPFVIAFATLLGIICIGRVKDAEKDPGYIVIDEVIGMLVTTLGHSLSVGSLIKAFILFRAFDILKPYPIRKVERLPGAYGIIADDVLAAVFADLALFLWERLA
jgi:phosphatidylglycerophosphatase A